MTTIETAAPTNSGPDTVAPSEATTGDEARSGFFKEYDAAWNNTTDYYKGRLGDAKESAKVAWEKVRDHDIGQYAVRSLIYSGKLMANTGQRLIGNYGRYEIHPITKPLKFAGRVALGGVGLVPYVAKTSFDRTDAGLEFNVRRRNTYRKKHDKATAQGKQRRAAKFQKKMDRKQKSINRGAA